MTFLEAAAVFPYTWTVIGISTAPFVILFLVKWIQYRPFRAAMKLPPEDVRIWTTSYMSDVTDDWGDVYQRRVDALWLRIKDGPVVEIAEGETRFRLIKKLEARGHKVSDRPTLFFINQ